MTLFSLLLFLMSYSHQRKFDSPTPESRLDLLHAILLKKTLNINAYHSNTPDKALFRGNYYSDKAPGTVALALPPFVLAVCALSLYSIDADSKIGLWTSSWVACAGSIGIISALGGAALFAWLSKHVAPRSALVTTLALFLGAAPLPYSTMMFSHALVVGLLAIAIGAIHKNSECGTRSSECGIREGETPSAERGRIRWFKANRWNLLAGFACGWALASEYSSGLVVVGLFLWMLSMMRNPSPSIQVGRSVLSPPGVGRGPSADAVGTPRPTFAQRVSAEWRKAIPFCLAAIPPLLLIPAYSWACFGDPFTLTYSYQASFPAMKEGLYAIKWPDAETAFHLLFSPARGLLFWTPFFLMAGLGYWQLIQKSRGLFWLTYAVPLLQIVVISGRTWDWPAGPAWGPRLLSPMIPLLALPCAFGVQKLPKLGFPLAVYSILVTTLATLTDACPSFNQHPNPLFDLNIPLFLKGEFSPNLGMVLGLPPYASVALFYAILIGGVWWLWRRLPKEKEPLVQTRSTHSD